MYVTRARQSNRYIVAKETSGKEREGKKECRKKSELVRRRKREERTDRNKSTAGDKVKKVQEGRKGRMPVRNVSNEEGQENKGERREVVNVDD